MNKWGCFLFPGENMTKDKDLIFLHWKKNCADLENKEMKHIHLKIVLDGHLHSSFSSVQLPELFLTSWGHFNFYMKWNSGYKS